MTKYSIVLIVIISFVIIVGIIFVPFVNNYLKYCKNKDNVFEYIESHYDIEFQLINSKIGKNSWPANRQEDEFVFFDVTNDIYFQIICGENDVYDYYSESFNGKEVSDKVTKTFSQDDFDYYIRCYGEKSSSENSSYEFMNCQLFFLVENECDIFEVYEVVSFMKDEFSDLNLKLIIAPYSTEEQIVSLFEYEDNVPIDSIRSFYNKDLVLNSSLFTTIATFKQLLTN